MTSLDRMPASKEQATPESAFTELLKYSKFVESAAAERRAEGVPEEFLPKPVFSPELLPIRKRNRPPVRTILRWGSHIRCDGADVSLLVKYLESQGRNCHINTGAHGGFDVKS